jgi:hypothetical protein
MASAWQNLHLIVSDDVFLCIRSSQNLICARMDIRDSQMGSANIQNGIQKSRWHLRIAAGHPRTDAKKKASARRYGVCDADWHPRGERNNI